MAIRPGSCDGGAKASNSMSALGVPVCSCCWIESWLTVSLITTLSTYALRIGSVAASQAGLRMKVIFFVGVYESILYGPSETGVLGQLGAARQVRVDTPWEPARTPAGSACRRSTWPGGSSVKTTVWSSLAITPGSGVLSMYVGDRCGVLATLAKPSQNDW